MTHFHSTDNKQLVVAFTGKMGTFEYRQMLTGI